MGRRIFNGGIFAAGYRCQHGPAKTGSFLTFHDVNRDAEDICHDFSPERALGSATADLCAGDGNAERSGNFKGIADGKGYTFQNSLRHVGSRGIHCHTNERAAGVRIVVGRALSHEIGQEKDMVFAKLCDVLLLACIILCSDDLVHPPLVAGSCAEHAAHKVIFAVCMGESVKRIVAVYAELFTGNENGSGGSEGNIALAIADCSGSNSRCCIVSGSRSHFDVLRQL